VRFIFYIATRYLFAKKSRNAINVISAVSVAGVTVGTMALIIILSVFNGLEELVNRIFNAFDPDIRISASEGKVFTPDEALLARLDSLDGVISYSMILEENSLLKYGERQYIATVRGVDTNYSRVTRVDSTMIDGEFSLMSPGGRPQAVVGAGVANYLGLNINFITPLHIYVPRRTGSVTPDPENAFIDRYITPAGIFQIDQEFDSKHLFVPINFARELFEYTDEVSAIDVRTNPKFTAESVRDAIKAFAGPRFEVKTRYEQKEIFYKVMRSERLAIFIILTLILIIASFNIIGSLTMLIIEKERDIKILRSLGADNGLIKKIFLLEGWLISILGAAAGMLAGFIVCYIQQNYGVVKFNSETLMMNAYPVRMSLTDFIIVPATVLLIGFLAAWYPVRYLSRKYLSDGSAGLPDRKSAMTVASLILVVLLASCSHSSVNVRRKDTIPPEKMVNILTEMYLADGLLSQPSIKNMFETKDSNLNYVDIIGSYGYTKDKLDQTIKYYIAKNPRKLEKIFDQVLARLSESESRILSEDSQNQPGNLWNLKPSFSIPADGAYEKVWFSVPVRQKGFYHLTFNGTVYPDDNSLNLRTNVFFWKADSTKEGKREYWDAIYLINDGMNHEYTVSSELRDTTFTHIRGWLLDHDPQPGRWVKHVKITGIKLFKGEMQ